MGFHGILARAITTKHNLLMNQSIQNLVIIFIKDKVHMVTEFIV